MSCLVASGEARSQQTATPTPSAAPAPTMADAMSRLRANDPAGAIKILQPLTEREPNNARAFRVLGIALHQTKQYEQAVDAYTRVLAIEPNDATALYNLGCALALEGEEDKAFAALARAKASQRVDMAQIQADDDLKSLRKDPRFDALLPKPEDFENPFVEPVKILHEWRGEAAGDQFGWIARNLGDVDGDHVPDVVTSAPTKNVGGERAGRVYVYSTKSGKLLWTADGKPGDELGIGVEGAGDTNGDGVPDVIAGAPRGGYARVYSGKDGRVLLTLTADKKSDDFGRHVAGVGDVDHDGFADILVGAPGTAGAGETAGRAILYSGKDGKPLLTLTGERAGDQFGATVGGGMHGKKMLLIVGAPGAGPAKHGRVSIYDSLSAKPQFVIDSDETGSALGQMFVSVPGDVDGDGVPDVYASDLSNSAKGPQTGRVYVHSGRDGHRLLTLTGETLGEGFGTSPSNAGDVDGDGHADLIVGAWQYAGAASSGGRASLFSGRDGHLMKNFTCRIPGDTFGFDAVTMGDVDGDRTADLLITSAWSGVHGFHSGRVFVLSSGVRKAAAAKVPSVSR
ncbi:MAG: FG-GAP-like repeat-containing protein [Thermoanaerobaculia bacterium]